ncbi:hypothetical protein OIU78_002454 [Salix suchowensis]|nr:hypothetical protein OIU78_002454 [Salix suchowensis]
MHIGCFCVCHSDISGIIFELITVLFYKRLVWLDLFFSVNRLQKEFKRLVFSRFFHLLTADGIFVTFFFQFSQRTLC